MAILKEITESNELYLYMNGNLIYKRWLNTGQYKIFDVMAYDKCTSMSIREIEYENSNELMSIRAKVKIKPTEDGGRETGFISGYRPNHVFEYNSKGELLQTFIGDIVFDDQLVIQPGEEKEVIVRFLINQPIEKYLNKGQIWWLHEGIRIVGEAEVL